jgi:hypothetical protein
MLYAYAENTQEFIKPNVNVIGICPYCGEKLVSKCGDIKQHHFAHKSKSECGYVYHDVKSEWHEVWQHKRQPLKPGINYEVNIKNVSGYKKRADTITEGGYVIEYQKSPLPLKERYEREACYGKMIWVVHYDIANSKTWEKPTDVPILIDCENGMMRYLNLNDIRHIYRNVVFKTNEVITIENFVSDVVNGNDGSKKYFVEMLLNCNINYNDELKKIELFNKQKHMKEAYDIIDDVYNEFIKGDIIREYLMVCSNGLYNLEEHFKSVTYKQIRKYLYDYGLNNLYVVVSNRYLDLLTYSHV